MSVHKIRIKNKFYLFKIHLVQELSEDDSDRIEFCEDIMQKVNEEPAFLSKIAFWMKQYSNFLNILINIIAGIGAIKMNTGLMKRIHNIFRKLSYGLLTIV